MKPNPLPFLAEKWAGVAEPTATFPGKIIIITGANSGLGLAAAAKFVSLQAGKVIIGVRSVSKGAVAAREIEEKTQRKGVVEVWELDMDHYSSVQKFAERVNKELPKLDVAILNAGVTLNEYTVGPEGWEETIAVNVMSTALLGLLLLPKMKASKASDTDLSHLVIVTSEAHRWLEDSDFPDPSPYGGNLVQALSVKPTDKKPWDGLLQNARSKLFAMYVSQGLATLATSQTGKPDVIVTPMCPGACKSDLMRNVIKGSFGKAIAFKIFDILFNKSAEDGARAYVQSATLTREFQGCWYKTTRVTDAGSFVTSDKGRQMQRMVWKEIVDSLQVKVPKVLEIVEGRS